MENLSQSIENLKESLTYLAEENISEMSEAELVDYAVSFIHDIVLDNSLYEIAVKNNITGTDFDRWADLAMDKLENQKEDETIEEHDLVALLKDVRS
jgi:alcohol dehydrogenase class IV